jgi:hypothetical protein
VTAGLRTLRHSKNCSPPSVKLSLESGPDAGEQVGHLRFGTLVVYLTFRLSRALVAAA